MADSMDGDPMGEDYEGMGTSPSKLGESNSSPQGVILSRLSTSSRRRHMTDSTSSSSASSKITDEDLLNTLFQSCDTENVGRVPASQLIECIQMIVLPSDIEAEQHLENLAQTLDPTGLNMSVDLQTYHDRISMWVASLKNQNSGLSEGDDNLNTIQEEDGGPPHGSPVWKSRRKVDTSLATDTSLNVSAFSYGSLEAYGGDTDNKPSYQDRMAELRHNNRMLADHNKDLQAQLETTEESRMELLRQCEEAEEKIKSLGGRNASLREEIKELHLETSGLQDMNSELKSKVLDLEKEKMSLESTIHLLENEDRDNILLHEKIQFLEEEHSRAQTEIRTKDTKLSESKNRLQSIQIQFLEKKKRYDDLHQSHRELQDAFKLLKMEKSDIEQELSQVHQKMTSSLAGLGLKAPVTPDLTGEFPQLQSTPDEHNLQSELRIFVAESHLPSPIYGPVTYETGGKSEMMQKLHSTTESIIAEVEKMVTVQQEDASAEDRDFLGQTITKLRSQLESLLCNMKWVMEAKKNSDHRAIKMGEDLKAVRDENHRLKQSRDSGDGMDSLNHRLSQIQNELELSRAEVEIMEFTAKRDQQKITDLESMCLLLQKELDVTRFDLKTQTSGLEEHVQMRYKAEEELEDTRRLLAEAQTELDCMLLETQVQSSQVFKCPHCHFVLEAGLNEAEPSSAAGLPQNAREQPDFPTTGPARDLEDVVRSLQLANQELGQEGEVFEQSFDDVDLVVPTLDSGYRTATSLTQGLVPVKNGQRLLTHSPPQHLSAIIDALALDVFQKADRPLPFGTSPSLPPQFLTFCPHCKYHQGQLVQEIHVGVDHSDFPRKLYDGDINTVDSSNGDIGCDSPSDTGISHAIGIQTDTVSVSEKETSCAESAVLSSCHVALQTESVAVISESLGTQTVPESVGPSREKPPSMCREVQCQAIPTVSQGVLALVVLKNAQSQTKSEEQPPAIQQNTTSQTELSSRDLIAKQSTACIATQTLPQSSARSLRIASDVSIPVPPPPSDHQTKGKVPSALTLPSSNYLLPTILPNRVLSEDWDSDISADSPSFVSALSSPVSLSPLPFGKTESTQPAIPADIETVSFKPIVPHRERMEQAVPAPIDENSNTELNPEIESQKMQVERSPALHLEKSPMRQRRILERGERSYSSVIQGSDGQLVDLATADIDISAITLADQELNAKLLEESKKASEKFNNRRGRKFTPMQKEAAVENGLEESSPESSPELPKEGVSHKSIAEEERVGAEGDSDPEEVKGISRKDSDDIDVKADIIKAIGPITGDRPPKSSLSSSKIRQEKKTKRPTFKQPMPELAEDTEFETCEDTSPTSPLLSNGTLEAMSEGCKDVCCVDSAAECSIQPEGTVKWEGGEGENKQRKSSILSDSLLKALGLKKGDGDPNTSLTEQEVEEKYNSLTFAFKTDRMTLEHRFKLQQHQRNVVEQNLQEEMQEHTTVVQSLERRCAEDEIARTDINKLKQHIDVMQYAFVKLASKAEGYGAVQQEERLSRAAEIMVSHVENIKRLLDRERAELAEAKKLLKDNKILMRGNSTNSLGLHDDTEGNRLRRSSTLTSPSMKRPNGDQHSLHGFVRQKIMRKSTVTSDPTDLDEAGRRRASVAAVLGFGSNASGQTTHATNHNRALSVPVAIGTKSLQFMRKDGRGRFASLANAAIMDRSSMGPGLLGGRSILDTHKEKEGDETSRGGTTSPRLGMPDKPKKKLSISLSSPALRVSEHPMSPTRSLSSESQTSFSKSPVPSPTGSASPCPSPMTPEPASSPEGEPVVPQEKSKQEMEIFQEGFEQGVRSQISQELSDLREQQRVLCENLEEIMEAADDEEEEDTLKKSDKQPVIRWLQQYSRNIPWSQASRLGRLFLTGALFLLALISIVWTLLPVERCQGGLIIRSDLWESFKTILAPYTGLSNPLPPPT